MKCHPLTHNHISFSSEIHMTVTFSRTFQISLNRAKVRPDKAIMANDIISVHAAPPYLNAKWRCTQEISMLVISMLLRSLEQINICGTFAESLMLNCGFFSEEDSCETFVHRPRSHIITILKGQDTEKQTAA